MKVTLDHIHEETENIRTFWFRPERPLRYIAGQFIELRIPHENSDKRGQKRWFTLSSSPSEELVSITTKFAADNGSSFKHALAALQPGQEVEMSDAMGDFVLPKDKALSITFVAGGIGITPMRSMVKWLHDNQEQREVQLLYAVNQPSEMVFQDDFKAYGAVVKVTSSHATEGWEGDTGYVTADKIVSQLPSSKNNLIYLSGPEPMIETLFKGLKEQGIDKRSIVTDYFPGYTEI